ncbi:MAG TPA: hypothetical protein DIU00_22245 [Phycisphaerales bacterium]|nr:hypothetical protein [Phycisphaerales bacterium]
MIDFRYISLEVLAIRLALPQKYLRELAESKKIPSLKIGCRLRFNSEAVQETLDKLAEEGANND